MTTVEEAYPRIRRYVLSLVRDDAEAEDLTQEAFLRAHRQHAQLRDPKAEVAWLYRIATHVTVDRMRERSRRQELVPSTALEPENPREPADEGPALQQVIEQGEMTACVQSYIVGLPDTYRSVLLLSDVHEMSGPEIARMLGVSLPTVKIRLHRARQKLRAALQVACAFERDARNVLVCEEQPPG